MSLSLLLVGVGALSLVGLAVALVVRRVQPGREGVYLTPEAQDRTVAVRRRPITGPARILVAEDDSAFRELVITALERDGYLVEGVADGWTLTKKLEQDWPQPSFDIVITDVRMPLLTGFEALGVMRSTGIEVPVVLMSAFCDAETHAGATRLGAAAVLDKPLDLRELRRTIQQLVEERSVPAQLALTPAPVLA